VARAAGLSEVLSGFPRARPGLPGDPGLLPWNSVVRRVNAETALLLGGQRALLLQIAHPDVAAGVADHSDFQESPFDRLWRTLGAMLEVVFGDADQAAGAATRVGGVHAGVHGRRGDHGYDARDPQLLLWVHATIVDTGLRAYEAFVHPLPRSVQERYYAEMKLVAAAFGVPEGLQPPGLVDFERYLEDALGRLTVTSQARELARDVLFPPVSPVLRPATATLRLATAGLLPGRIRDAYALEWARTRSWRFRCLEAATRYVVPVLPSRVRRWPHAAMALARMGENPQVSG